MKARIFKIVHLSFVSIAIALALNLACAIAPATFDAPLSPTVAQAQTTKQKIRSAYRKQVKKIAKAHAASSGRRFAYYKFVDVCGSSQEELLVWSWMDDASSGAQLHVYTYKSGKVKLLLHESWGNKCGDSGYQFYKKSNGMVIKRLGWGMEICSYYKMSGGTYKLVAQKMRQSTLAGANENGPWSYSDAKGSIAKSTFNKRVKAVTKGSCKKVKASYTWTTMTV